MHISEKGQLSIIFLSLIEKLNFWNSDGTKIKFRLGIREMPRQKDFFQIWLGETISILTITFFILKAFSINKAQVVILISARL